jgi:hypothetical protein
MRLSAPSIVVYSSYLLFCQIRNGEDKRRNVWQWLKISLRGSGVFNWTYISSQAYILLLHGGDPVRRILQRLVLISIAALAGCDVRFVDVSNDPAFRSAVGVRSEVVGALHAYGIREHSMEGVKYITLIPPPGIAGSEVVFTITVQPGSQITVLKILKSNRWPDPELTLEIKLTSTRMALEAVTRIDLLRGYEGETQVQLNPRVYRRIVPDLDGLRYFRDAQSARATQNAPASGAFHRANYQRITWWS